MQLSNPALFFLTTKFCCCIPAYFPKCLISRAIRQSRKKSQKQTRKKVKKTIDISEAVWYYPLCYPGVAQLGARLTGGQEAVSSSLATRTIKEFKAFALGSFIFYARLEQGTSKARKTLRWSVLVPACVPQARQRRRGQVSHYLCFKIYFRSD